MNMQSILIIGSGRLARHLEHYFELLKQSRRSDFYYSNWCRSKNTADELRSLLANADIVLLAISDQAILPFFETHLANLNLPIVHMSGSLVHSTIVGIHPLCTFGETFYDLDFYKSIVLVIDDASSQHLASCLPNDIKLVSKEQKHYYHALCVMSGNFTQLLWLMAHREFARLGINRKNLEPYLASTFRTINDPSFTTATGPFVRADLQTIDGHLRSLPEEALPLYQAFLESYKLGVFRNEKHI